MSQTQEWIKEKFQQESQLGVNTEYNNMRLTREIEELKGRIKQLETDMAYQTYATSPEEQRIYDLRRTD
jgi:predicted nuclease with TOPRIM domain